MKFFSHCLEKMNCIFRILWKHEVEEEVCDSLPHEGSEYCIKHCEKLGHDHCAHFYCDSLPHKEGSSDWCMTHCKVETCGHCTYGCELTPHEGSFRCITHCPEKNHGHCVRYCDLPSHFLDMCERHCWASEHGHSFAGL